MMADVSVWWLYHTGLLESLTWLGELLGHRRNPANTNTNTRTENNTLILNNAMEVNELTYKSQYTVKKIFALLKSQLSVNSGRYR